VAELLLPDGQGWDIGKLNELFYEGDVEDIMRIPVGRAGTEDYIAWNQTKNGIFSVKSAYHLHMQLKSSHEIEPVHRVRARNIKGGCRSGVPMCRGRHVSMSGA
jgi:hypothetical protein